MVTVESRRSYIDKKPKIKHRLNRKSKGFRKMTSSRSSIPDDAVKDMPLDMAEMYDRDVSSSSARDLIWD